MDLPDWELYRLLHRGNPGDVEFYQRASEGSPSVLELGCGWGRITGALTQPGRLVVGLEAEANLRSQAESQVTGAQIVAGDMRGFEMPRQFHTIIIPYNAIYCLGGRDGLAACLRACEQHLDQGGDLWLDCYPVDDFHQAALAGEIPPDDDEPVLRFEANGEELWVLERTEIVPQNQHLEVRYEVVDARGNLKATTMLNHHYLLSHQILSVAEDVGLSASVVSGSFQGAPLDEDAEQLVIGFERSEA